MSKITYKDAIETLQAMFSTLDEETLKSVLVMNKGLLEPTIECLLKLTGEDNEEQQPKSMFNPGGNNEEFNDDPFYLSSIQKNQEDQDRALAYKLQKKYIKQANALQEEEKYHESQQKQHGSKKGNKPPIRGPEVEENDEPEPYEPEPEENMGNNGEEDDLHVNNKPFKKEKKSFKEKMKSAKESFFSIFKKKKKTNPNANAGVNSHDNKGKPQEIIAFDEEEDNDVVLLPVANPNQGMGNQKYPDLNH